MGHRKSPDVGNSRGVSRIGVTLCQLPQSTLGGPESDGQASPTGQGRNLWVRIAWLTRAAAVRHNTEAQPHDTEAQSAMTQKQPDVQSLMPRLRDAQQEYPQV